MINRNDIQSLIKAAKLAGFKVNLNQIHFEVLAAGTATHTPKKLPKNCCAVYVFKHGDYYLKVGKAGVKSNPRYQSQHYTITKTRKSGLAISLTKDTRYSPIIGDFEPKIWIKENTTRFNIIFPSSLGEHFLNFVEAFFILKCNPLFEG